MPQAKAILMKYMTYFFEVRIATAEEDMKQGFDLDIVATKNSKIVLKDIHGRHSSIPVERRVELHYYQRKQYENCTKSYKKTSILLKTIPIVFL